MAEFVLTGISHKKVFAGFQNEVAFLGGAFFYGNMLIFVILIGYLVLRGRIAK